MKKERLRELKAEILDLRIALSVVRNPNVQNLLIEQLGKELGELERVSSFSDSVKVIRRTICEVYGDREILKLQIALNDIERLLDRYIL